MTTGSIQSASLTLSKHKETFLVFLSLINNSGGALNDGETVFLNGNNQVDKLQTADSAETPIGIVDVACPNDGDYVTVATSFQRTLKAHNQSGGALVAGDLVRPNGVINANGRPEYIASIPDDLGPTAEVVGTWATAIVLEGAADDTEIVVGVFRTPIRPLPITD